MLSIGGKVTIKKNSYVEYAKKIKVLTDPKRLEIIDLLSCGDLCACQILEHFHISQPTLSSDMKKLEESGIVNSRREGKNIYYSLNKEVLDDICIFIDHISTKSDDCICRNL